MRVHDGRLRVWGTLPDRYGDRQIAASTIDAQGRIVALIVDPDVECARRGGDNAPFGGTLVLVDGRDCHETVVRDLALRFPKIDVLDDGFVLAASRCPMPSGPPARTFEELELEVPRNAMVVDTAGDTKASFHVGDAIEHLMTDAAGTIWVGYFDEAFLCAPHPVPRGARPGDRPRGRVTLSMPGLSRWTGTGDPLWIAVRDAMGPRNWVDCYALNVGRDLTWAYPYPGFPLFEIDDLGVRCVRRTPGRSASGVLVSGDHCAFLAPSGRKANAPGVYELTVARIITRGPVEAVSTTPVSLPDGTRPGRGARRTVCRDHRMWLQFDDPLTWYVLEIGE